MTVINPKKPMVIAPEKMQNVLRAACQYGVLAKVYANDFSFNGAFLNFDQQALVLDNRLMHFDDVRQLRKQELTLLFPYKRTILKGTIRLLGLTTYKSIRALRFSLPMTLTTDEKRGVRRIGNLPQESRLIFHTQDMHIYHGRIYDASPSGFAMVIEKAEIHDRRFLIKAKTYQAEAILSAQIKLSFRLEIRHIETLLEDDEIVGTYKLGLKILKLDQVAQDRLNQWLLKCNSREEFLDGSKQGDQTKKEPLIANLSPNSILIVGPESLDFEFWHKCLDHKYDVITTDDNISNIRDALNIGPALLLMYLDSNNADRSSFTRKFCASLKGRFPIMFFGHESHEAKQKTLMGNIPNQGFLDINERQIRLKFRKIEHVMDQLHSNS